MKVAKGTVEHGVYNKNKQVFCYEKQKVLTPRQNAEMSNLETIRSVAQAGIANYNFVQGVPNEILVSCFQPLEVILVVYEGQN